MLSTNRMERLSFCELTTMEVFDVFAREFCSGCVERLPLHTERMRGIDSIFHLISIRDDHSKFVTEVSSLFLEQGRRRFIFANPEHDSVVEVVYTSNSDDVASDVQFFIDLLAAVCYRYNEVGGGLLSLDSFLSLTPDTLLWKRSDHRIVSIEYF